MTAADVLHAVDVLSPVVEAIAKYAAGEGPRPPALDQLPEISDAKKAQLDGLAAARLAAKGG